LEFAADIRLALLLDDKGKRLAGFGAKTNLCDGRRDDVDGDRIGAHRNLPCRASLTRRYDFSIACGDLALDHAIVVNSIGRNKLLIARLY